MKRVATLLVWLALLFGLPQVVICGVMIFSAGWLVAPLVAILLLLPIVPLILMQDIRRWQRLPPAATASVALLSIALSAGFYWMLYYRMR
jgi:hypothetical protein